MAVIQSHSALDNLFLGHFHPAIKVCSVEGRNDTLHNIIQYSTKQLVDYICNMNSGNDHGRPARSISWDLCVTIWSSILPPTSTVQFSTVQHNLVQYSTKLLVEHICNMNSESGYSRLVSRLEHGQFRKELVSTLSADTREEKRAEEGYIRVEYSEDLHSVQTFLVSSSFSAPAADDFGPGVKPNFDRSQQLPAVACIATAEPRGEGEQQGTT